MIGVEGSEPFVRTQACRLGGRCSLGFSRADLRGAHVATHDHARHVVGGRALHPKCVRDTRSCQSWGAASRPGVGNEHGGACLGPGVECRV